MIVTVITAVLCSAIFIFLRKREEEKKRIKQEQQLKVWTEQHSVKPKIRPTYYDANCKNCGANIFSDYICIHCGTYQRAETKKYSPTSGFATSGTPYMTSGFNY